MERFLTPVRGLSRGMASRGGNGWATRKMGFKIPIRLQVVLEPLFFLRQLKTWMPLKWDLTSYNGTQFHVNRALKQGIERQAVQPGSVSFIQRFGSALQLNLHVHLIAIEGVFLDRTAQGWRRV